MRKPPVRGRVGWLRGFSGSLGLVLFLKNPLGTLGIGCCTLVKIRVRGLDANLDPEVSQFRWLAGRRIARSLHEIKLSPRPAAGHGLGDQLNVERLQHGDGRIYRRTLFASKHSVETIATLPRLLGNLGHALSAYHVADRFRDANRITFQQRVIQVFGDGGGIVLVFCNDGSGLSRGLPHIHLPFDFSPSSTRRRRRLITPPFGDPLLE